jgi:prevent-host-death family protein
MSDMRIIAVRELHHQLKAVLDQVERGETVEIRRRNRPVARLVPPAGRGRPEPWPDLLGRVRAIYGNRRVSEATSSVISRDRGD